MHVIIFTRRLPLLFTFILFSIHSGYAQIADFTFRSTDTLLCSPQRIAFTQTCTGNPIGFVWNFGNDEKGMEPGETIVYNTGGTYNVTLTALYPSHAVSVTKIITINPTPAITLSADKNLLCQSGTVQFSTAGSSSIAFYEWDFGDDSGVILNDSGSMRHAYTDYGNYTASVKATTAAGCSARSTYAITVSKFGITGSLAADTGCIPVIASLNINSSLPAGDRVLNYTWDFGDGAPSITNTNSTVNHRYNTTDSINNAHVLVTTAQGCSNRFDFTPFAFGTPPLNTVASIAMMKDTFCASETIVFNARATNANYYVWDFGDSSQNTSADTLVSHKYRSLGSKTVIVTPFFNGCAGPTDTITVFIKGVIANFNYRNLCNDKKTYRFTNESLGNPSSFQWEFSDRPLVDAVNRNVTHEFPDWGSFTAALSLTDSLSGCTDKESVTIYTAAPALTSNVNSVCRDSLMVYSVSNSYADSAGYTYEFHVNGTVVNNGPDSILRFRPTKHGSYTDYVVLKDANAGTCHDTLQMNSNILVKGPSSVFFTQPRRCVDQPFSFTNNSYPYNTADAISTWRWTFGDETESAEENPPPHVYKKAGTYAISLIATDVNGCSQRSSRVVIAERLPRINAFPAMDTICQARDTAMLTGYTIDTLAWLPATNISCISCDSTLVYPFTTTSYIAKATNSFGCTSYDTCIVKVFAPFNLTISPADTTVCPSQPVPYLLNADGITHWAPAAFLNNNSIKNPVATPAENTEYSVIVSDSAGCYSDTATASVQVYPLPAVDAGPDRVIPYNSSFTLAPVYNATVAAYLWEPAVGLSCNNCPAPSGTLLQSTTYTIKTTSVQGCTASDKITLAIACENRNLLLPTAFSPNGNGINEYFYPITRGYRIIKKFVIFNRRGNKVFERQNFAPNDRSAGWNGIIRGAETVTTTESFVWYVEAECEQGELVTSKGTVVLVK
jgi:PKD repeat protein